MNQNNGTIMVDGTLFDFFATPSLIFRHAYVTRATLFFDTLPLRRDASMPPPLPYGHG